MERSNRDWSDAVRESMRDSVTSTDAALWDRVSHTLDTTRPATHRRLIWGVISTATAAAILAFALLHSYPDEEVIEQMVREVVAEVKQEEVHPIRRETAVDIIADNRREIATLPANRDLTPHTSTPKEIAPTPKEIAPTTDNAATQTADTAVQEASPKESEQPSIIERETAQIALKTPRTTTLSLQYSGAMTTEATNPATATPYDIAATKLTATFTEVNFEDTYQNCEVKHHQPFSVGVKVQHLLTKRLYLSSGINYTLLLSDVVLMYNSEETRTQKIHFVGVPLAVNYRFVEGRAFSVYAGGGGSVEYCVGARVGSENINERDWHYSAEVSLGAEYRFNSRLGLYFEPSLAHYFTTTNLRSIRNDSPTTFNLRLGVSFTL